MLGDPQEENGRVILTLDGPGKVTLPPSIREVYIVTPVNTGWVVKGSNADGTMSEVITIDRTGHATSLASSSWLSFATDADRKRVAIFTSENPYSDASRPSQLRVITLGTTQRLSFEAPGGFGEVVDWTGDKLAVVAGRGEPGVDLRIFDLVTGSWTTISVGGETEAVVGCDRSSTDDLGFILVKMPSGNHEFRVVNDSRLRNAPIRVPEGSDEASWPELSASPNCRYAVVGRLGDPDAAPDVVDIATGSAVRVSDYPGKLRLYGTSWESDTTLVGQVTPAVNDQALWVRFDVLSRTAEQFTAPVGQGPGVPRSTAP